MPTQDLSDATLVTTLGATDRVVSLTAAGNAQQIVKTDLMTEILGDNVTEADLDKLHDVTSTAAELNVLDGVSGSLVVADVNILAGQAAAGLTGTELGYVKGLTSDAQKQLDTKIDTTSSKYIPRTYIESFTTGAGETTKTVSAATIMPIIGLSTTTHYIIASSPTYSVSAGDPASGGIEHATNMTFNTAIVSGSTYKITEVTFSGLTASTAYMLNITVVTTLIP